MKNNNLHERYYSSKPFSSYSNYMLETPKLPANLSLTSKPMTPTEDAVMIPSNNLLDTNYRKEERESSQQLGRLKLP
jgi:hypothetical protein